MTTITLNPDGPHSPEYTRQVAAAVAEGVRVLNYATRDSEALQCPPDVDSVVQDLATTAQRLPQLLEQLSNWLGIDYAAGGVEVSHGPHAGNPREAVGQVRSLLGLAANTASSLYLWLDEARQITSTLSSARSEGGEGG